MGAPRLPGDVTTDHLVLLSFLAISLSFNVYAALKLELRPPHHAGLGTSSGFRRGESFPAGDIQVKRLDGSVLPLRLNASRPTIVYVFTPSCSWCQRNRSAVSRLVALTRPRFDFLALSLEERGVEEFSHGTAFRDQTASLVSASDGLRARIGSIPETLVVSDVGVILERWQGAYIGETKARVEQYFQATLPPLD